MSDNTSKEDAPAGAATCAHCDSETQPGAQFCHVCGEPLHAAFVRSRRNTKRIAWVAAIAVGIAVVAVTSVLLTGQDEDAGKDEFPVFPRFDRPGTSPGRPVDLTKMTPRQAADRLFNRIMMASEQRNVAEAKRFAPMALQAYGGLDRLDADAHYHLGLIHSIRGDFENVRKEIGVLRQLTPNHLLAIILEHRVAELAGDQEAVGRAYVAFGAAYDDEIKAQRPEYAAHRGTIEKFHATASRP